MTVAPTRPGQQHAVTQIAENEAASAARWPQLPEVSTINAPLPLKPGATMLLTGSDTRGRNIPVLASRVGDIDCDETLFERLRALRKRLADQRGVPPYIVFGDATLRLMAKQFPTTESEFLQVSGVGDKKLRDYGEAFLGTIREYLAESRPPALA